MADLERTQIGEAQRLDKHYALISRRGYDPTTGEHNDKGGLSNYAAKRSRQTRARLFVLIGGEAE